MIERSNGAPLRALELLHAQNPALFDRLMTVLADRPEHGEVTLRFRDGRLFLIDRHDSYR